MNFWSSFIQLFNIFLNISYWQTIIKEMNISLTSLTKSHLALLISIILKSSLKSLNSLFITFKIMNQTFKYNAKTQYQNISLISKTNGQIFFNIFKDFYILKIHIKNKIKHIHIIQINHQILNFIKKSKTFTKLLISCLNQPFKIWKFKFDLFILFMIKNTL